MSTFLLRLRAPLLKASLLFPFALLGCASPADSPVAPQVPSESMGATAASNPQTNKFKTQDEIFAEIADRVPGYAGTYYAADGTPVTNLVDLNNRAAAAREIASLIRSGARGARVQGRLCSGKWRTTFGS